VISTTPVHCKSPITLRPTCFLLLQALCERAVATRHVEPRTALEVLHYADAAGAGALKRCVPVAPQWTNKVSEGAAGCCMARVTGQGASDKQCSWTVERVCSPT